MRVWPRRTGRSEPVRHGRARLAETAGDLRPDAAARASHDGDFVCEQPAAFCTHCPLLR